MVHLRSRLPTEEIVTMNNQRAMIPYRTPETRQIQNRITPLLEDRILQDVYAEADPEEAFPYISMAWHLVQQNPDMMSFEEFQQLVEQEIGQELDSETHARFLVHVRNMAVEHNEVQVGRSVLRRDRSVFYTYIDDLNSTPGMNLEAFVNVPFNNRHFHTAYVRDRFYGVGRGPIALMACQAMRKSFLQTQNAVEAINDIEATENGDLQVFTKVRGSAAFITNFPAFPSANDLEERKAQYLESRDSDQETDRSDTDTDDDDDDDAALNDSMNTSSEFKLRIMGGIYQEVYKQCRKFTLLAFGDRPDAVLDEFRPMPIRATNRFLKDCPMAFFEALHLAVVSLQTAQFFSKFKKAVVSPFFTDIQGDQAYQELIEEEPELALGEQDTIDFIAIAKFEKVVNRMRLDVKPFLDFYLRQPAANDLINLVRATSGIWDKSFERTRQRFMNTLVMCCELSRPNFVRQFYHTFLAVELTETDVSTVAENKSIHTSRGGYQFFRQSDNNEVEQRRLQAPQMLLKRWFTQIGARPPIYLANRPTSGDDVYDCVEHLRLVLRNSLRRRQNGGDSADVLGDYRFSPVASYITNAYMDVIERNDLSRMPASGDMFYGVSAFDRQTVDFFTWSAVESPIDGLAYLEWTRRSTLLEECIKRYLFEHLPQLLVTVIGTRQRLLNMRDYIATEQGNLNFVNAAGLQSDLPIQEALGLALESFPQEYRTSFSRTPSQIRSVTPVGAMGVFTVALRSVVGHLVKTNALSMTSVLGMASKKAYERGSILQIVTHDLCRFMETALHLRSVCVRLSPIVANLDMDRSKSAAPVGDLNSNGHAPVSINSLRVDFNGAAIRTQLDRFHRSPPVTRAIDFNVELFDVLDIPAYRPGARNDLAFLVQAYTEVYDKQHCRRVKQWIAKVIIRHMKWHRAERIHVRVYATLDGESSNDDTDALSPRPFCSRATESFVRYLQREMRVFAQEELEPPIDLAFFIDVRTEFERYQDNLQAAPEMINPYEILESDNEPLLNENLTISFCATTREVPELDQVVEDEEFFPPNGMMAAPAAGRHPPAQRKRLERSRLPPTYSRNSDGNAKKIERKD